jgi:hypothetical protein
MGAFKFRHGKGRKRWCGRCHKKWRSVKTQDHIAASNCPECQKYYDSVPRYFCAGCDMELASNNPEMPKTHRCSRCGNVGFKKKKTECRPQKRKKKTKKKCAGCNDLGGFLHASVKIPCHCKIRTEGS